MNKDEYDKNFIENVEDLVSRLKRDSYNPQPSRRVRIPKPGKAGKTRPLGISCCEDKLVESAIAKLSIEFARFNAKTKQNGF